jgi:hypothetical protein
MHTQVGLPQPICQHFLLGSNLCAKRCSDSFMEHEQLVDGHRIKVAMLRDSLLHDTVPINDRAIMNYKAPKKERYGLRVFRGRTPYLHGISKGNT